MGAPWEKYQAQSQSQPQPEGPWTKYQSAEAPAAQAPAADRPWYSVTPGGIVDAFKEYLPSLPTTDPNRPWYDVTAKGTGQAALNSVPMAGAVAGSLLGPLGTAGGAMAGESLRSTAQSAISGQNPTRPEFYGNVANAGKTALVGQMGLESLPPAFNAASSAASDVAPWAAKKIGRVLADVPEQTTENYLKDPASINAAPERNQISDKILEMKKAAEDKVEQAHNALSDAKTALSDNKGDVRAGLQDQKFDLNGKLKDAQSSFDEKKQAFKEALKSNHLTSMASDVQGAVGDLKDQVVQGSNDAYDILGKSKGSVKIEPMLDILQKHADDLRVNGVATSASAQQAVQEIKAMHDRLWQMTKHSDGNLSLPQAKQVLQGLDKDIQYNKGAGTFAPQTDQAFSDLRRTIDQNVKSQSEPYKQKMLDVSRKVQLLNKASDLYGTPEKAISNLNSITSEKGQALHVPMLENLGKETGRDLANPVKGYLLNDKILKTPSLFDQAIEEIPEAKALAQAKARMAETSDPSYSRTVSEAAHEPLLKKIQQYQADLENAKTGKDLFSGVTPDSVTAKTKALGGKNNYGAEIKFGDIDAAHGTDLEKQIKARNDLDQFNKTDQSGSRKTLLGAVIGGGLGHLVDHAFLGAELGAGAGAALDKYSGQIFKAALDKGMSTADALKAAAPKVGTVTKIGTKAATSSTIGGTSSSAMSAAASNDTKGPDKWAKDGADKLIQHAESPQDKAAIEKLKGATNDPKTKQLLIQASDLKPGTRAMDVVMAKLKSKIASGD